MAITKKLKSYFYNMSLLGILVCNLLQLPVQENLSRERTSNVHF